MTTQINCPHCQKKAAWQNNPHRPFCSERCQLIDLGQWSSESYRIPGPTQESTSDDNVIQLNQEKQDLERQ